MSLIPPHLRPPTWAAHVRDSTESLKVVSVRMDDNTLSQLEELRERLNHPTRAALLRYLLAVGLFVVREQLDREP